MIEMKIKLLIVVSVVALVVYSLRCRIANIAFLRLQSKNRNTTFCSSSRTICDQRSAAMAIPSLRHRISTNWPSQGVRFDRAYAQYPLCNPSRSSLLTGKYPTQTSILDNEYYFRALHPELVSLTQHFKANGYATLRAGKIFHGGIDDTDSWTEGGEARNFTGAKRPPSNAEGPERVAQSDRIVMLDGDGEKNGDYQDATRSIEYLEKYKDQTFLPCVRSVKATQPADSSKEVLRSLRRREDPFTSGLCNASGRT